MRSRGGRAGWFSPRPDGQDLQPEIAPDAVLEMNHEVALFQLGEINVQRRTRGLGVGRFEPARPLHFVTAKDFGVGDDDHAGLFAKKTAMSPQSTVHSPWSVRLAWLWTVGRGLWTFQIQLFPNFAKPLPLAVVVAEQVDGITLAGPTL